MSTESLRRGGCLSIKTDGDQSEVTIEGKKIDHLFNLAALTMVVAENLNLPVELLMLMLVEQVDRVKKGVQQKTEIDLGEMERMVGRGNDQKN